MNFRMFQRIIRCPILFFDINPIGMLTKNSSVEFRLTILACDP